MARRRRQRRGYHTGGNIPSHRHPHRGRRPQPRGGRMGRMQKPGGQLLSPWPPLPPGYTCFTPNQLINMADGSKKKIIDIREGDKVQVYDMESKSIKESSVNLVEASAHDDVYKVTLEDGKVIEPTGNHPILAKEIQQHDILRDEGPTAEEKWVTVDGHDPNHAGGDGTLEAGDYVYDITKDKWLRVMSIEPVIGDFFTYNFTDKNYLTIIADDIVTHNSWPCDTRPTRQRGGRGRFQRGTGGRVGPRGVQRGDLGPGGHQVMGRPPIGEPDGPKFPPSPRKIICEELYQQGLMPKHIYEADEQYGDKITLENPELMTGYLLFAQPIVDMMKKSSLFSKVVYYGFVKSWSEWMAYQMGIVKKTNRFGQFINWIGSKLCYHLYNKDKKKNKIVTIR
tara:strand:+ start:1182 stop:2366 length:1185 start_codon:yes stop_codon:yes gene_type:complete